MRDAAAARQHRETIGGLWDEMGEHQMRFLVAQGLQPQHRLLDIGCGPLRLGARAIRYLDPRRYFGTDISGDLVMAGYNLELDDALRLKTPPANFAINDNFDFGFLPRPVDMAIAQSVFPHLPLNHLRRCLATLAPKLVPGGRFFVTFFECPTRMDISPPLLQFRAGDPFRSGVQTTDYKDPYHHKVSDLEWAANPGTWSLELLGDWNHPQNQQMAVYVRRPL